MVDTRLSRLGFLIKIFPLEGSSCHPSHLFPLTVLFFPSNLINLCPIVSCDLAYVHIADLHIVAMHLQQIHKATMLLVNLLISHLLSELDSLQVLHMFNLNPSGNLNRILPFFLSCC